MVRKEDSTTTSTTTNVYIEGIFLSLLPPTPVLERKFLFFGTGHLPTSFRAESIDRKKRVPGIACVAFIPKLSFPPVRPGFEFPLKASVTGTRRQACSGPAYSAAYVGTHVSGNFPDAGVE